MHVISDVWGYDEESPSYLRWKVSIGRFGLEDSFLVQAGDVAGSLNADGYYMVKFKGATYAAHKLVWELHNGPIPEGYQVDHENGVRTDNSIVNLRLATHTDNMRNRCKLVNNTSGATGVSLAKPSTGGPYWRASWQEGNKFKHKYFSIPKLGHDEAFEAAKSFRASKISEIGGYTERHGT